MENFMYHSYEPSMPILDQSYERCGNYIPCYMLNLPQFSEGFYFGKKVLGDVCHFISKPSNCEGHISIFGCSGSGKSSSLIIPTICHTWTNPFFAVDIRGDLKSEYDKTSHERESKVLSLTSEPSSSFDPFHLLRQGGEENLSANIRELANSLIPMPKTLQETFWIDTARSFLCAVIQYYFDLGASFIETMTMVLITPANAIIKKIGGSKNYQAKIFINSFRKEVTDKKGNTHISIISDTKMLIGVSQEITNRLSVFCSDPRIVRAFSPSDNTVKWEDLETHNVFLSVPEDRLEQYGGILTMLITQLVRTLERRPRQHSPQGANQPPILCVLDEFPRLGRIEVITSAISTLRDRSVTLCLAMQNLAQLDDIYGEKTRCIILGNCSYKAILSANDADTQAYFSRLTGDIKTVTHGFTTNYTVDWEIFGYSASISESREPLIFPHEFATLNDIVLLTPQGFCRVDKYPFCWIKN